MPLKEELTAILSAPDSGINQPRLDLEETPGGRVGGFVVSPTFAGMPQIDRQDLLWKCLDRNLDRERIQQIISLVTVTPEEMADE